MPASADALILAARDPLEPRVSSESVAHHHAQVLRGRGVSVPDDHLGGFSRCDHRADLHALRKGIRKRYGVSGTPSRRSGLVRLARVAVWSGARTTPGAASDGRSERGELSVQVSEFAGQSDAAVRKVTDSLFATQEFRLQVTRGYRLQGHAPDRAKTRFSTLFSANIRSLFGGPYRLDCHQGHPDPTPPHGARTNRASIHMQPVSVHAIQDAHASPAGGLKHEDSAESLTLGLAEHQEPEIRCN